MPGTRTRTGDVGSLIRGLTVLEGLATRPDGVSPKDLVEETGIDRSTLQRLLRTLVSAGYAERVSRGRYAIATPALSLGNKLTQSHHLARVATPYLVDLRQRVGETTNVAVLAGVDVQYIARVATGNILSINLGVGTCLPAYCTSLGRAILAYLPQDQARAVLERSDRRKHTRKTKTSVSQLVQELSAVRARGYAFTDAELELGLRSIAAPLFGSEGTVLAAMNVSVPAARVSGSELKREIAPHLVESARALSIALGASETPRKTPN